MKTAEEWLTELTNGTKQAFPNIKRSDMVDGLKKRIASPKSARIINQRSASLCGPAAFMYCLATRMVADYAKYVVDLYHTGEAALGVLKVKPGADCKNYQHDPDKIDAVDWVALASLRDSENRRLDYDDPGKRFAGITGPGKLQEWFSKAGFKDDAEFTNLILTKDVGCLRAAISRCLQGHSVCLLIDSNLLNEPQHPITKPEHWVVLTSAGHVQNKRVTVDVYSWGKIWTMNRGVDVFCNKFYGYVSAR